MRILLISANWATSPYPVYPVGMSMVAAALKQAGNTVELFDFLQHGKSFEAVAERINTFGPEMVGISIRNIDNVNAAHEQRYIESVQQMVAVVRENSYAPVVLGGSGFSIMPTEILARVGADYGVVGEGEVLMCELVRALAKKCPPKQPILRAPQQLVHDSIPSAYYDPSMMDFYMNNGKVISIQTKRGCDKSCIYCSYPVLEGRDLRMRTPSAVVDDMERLVADLGASYIFFVDSVFNDAKGHYRAVVHEMHRRKLQIPWTGFFTPGGELDDEIVALMKETGLDAAEIGADAACDTTLRGICKDFLWQDVVACNELFIRHGVTTAHYYMFGGPDETRETVAEGIENIRNLRQTANFMFMGIRILPDTGLMELARREGMVTEATDIIEPVYYFSPHIERDWLEQTLTDGFADRFNCVFPPDALDDKLHLLHKLGFGGTAYNMLIGHKRRRVRTAD
jgi:lipid biosynthesis B12-binding/radical SAM protein